MTDGECPRGLKEELIRLVELLGMSISIRFCIALFLVQWSGCPGQVARTKIDHPHRDKEIHKRFYLAAWPQEIASFECL